MSYIYIRVPHYVGSYIRNLDEKKTVQKGCPVTLNVNSQFFRILKLGLHPNVNGGINPFGCFSEMQWNRMKRGFFIGKKHSFGKCRFVEKEELTESDVKERSDIKISSREGKSEFLCIKIPSEIFLDNRLMRVTKQWTLTSGGAIMLLGQFKEEFWTDFFDFISKERSWCATNGVKRTLLDMIERFMLRYDIDCSADEVEKKTLKRNYHRRMLQQKSKEINYVDHG